MSFADVQARTAEAVMRRLANAIATPAAGSAIAVIFDRATIEALGGQITSSGPVAMAQDADVAAWVSQLTTLTLASNADAGAVALGSFALIDKKPDGTGLTLLILEDAA